MHPYRQSYIYEIYESFPPESVIIEGLFLQTGLELVPPFANLQPGRAIVSPATFAGGKACLISLCLLIRDQNVRSGETRAAKDI